jgi:hypothetical protein
MSADRFDKVDDGIYRVTSDHPGTVVGYVARLGNRWQVVTKFSRPTMFPTYHALPKAGTFATRREAGYWATDDRTYDVG